MKTSSPWYPNEVTETSPGARGGRSWPARPDERPRRRPASRFCRHCASPHQPERHTPHQDSQRDVHLDEHDHTHKSPYARPIQRGLKRHTERGPARVVNHSGVLGSLRPSSHWQLTGTPCALHQSQLVGAEPLGLPAAKAVNRQREVLRGVAKRARDKEKHPPATPPPEQRPPVVRKGSSEDSSATHSGRRRQGLDHGGMHRRRITPCKAYKASISTIPRLASLAVGSSCGTSVRCHRGCCCGVLRRLSTFGPPPPARTHLRTRADDIIQTRFLPRPRRSTLLALSTQTFLHFDSFPHRRRTLPQSIPALSIHPHPSKLRQILFSLCSLVFDLSHLVFNSPTITCIIS